MKPLAAIALAVMLALPALSQPVVSVVKPPFSKRHPRVMLVVKIAVVASLYAVDVLVAVRK